MKHLWTLLVAMLALPLMANAQTRYTPSELDTLVSTIALYPDPLLVYVLDASMHGEDLPSASAFATAHRKLNGDDLASAIERADLDYDESVIALIPFPDVLRKMSKYATWTNQLGEAVELQKADVMDAVQRMRKVAHENGYLKSDDKVSVNVDGNVAIQPVREEYIYVPEYDPSVVYYVVSDNRIHIRYVNGVWTGAGLVYWGWDPFVYDWVHRRPYYRHPHRYAPPPPRHRPRRSSSVRLNNPPPAPQIRRPALSQSEPLRFSPSRQNSVPVLNKRVETPSSEVVTRQPSPPSASNYKRPVPPPPPSNSDDEDGQSSRWSDRQHGSRNAPPPPPPSRRSDHRRR